MEMLDPDADRFELRGIGEVVVGELAAISNGSAAECYNELSEGIRKALSDAFARSVLKYENVGTY